MYTSILDLMPVQQAPPDDSDQRAFKMPQLSKPTGLRFVVLVGLDALHRLFAVIAKEDRVVLTLAYL